MSNLPVLRRKQRWPWVVGGLAAGLLVVYLVGTSGWFIKSVVLPRVADSLGSDLTVEELSVSPFSSLRLRGVVLTPRGAEPLVRVGEATVRHRLFALLGGEVALDEVRIDGPEFTLVQKADGSSNLDPLLKALASQPKTESAGKKEAPRLAIRNVTVSKGLVRLTQPVPGGSSVTEVTGLGLRLDQLANGGRGKVQLEADLGLTQPTNQVRARLDGAVEVALTAAAAPDVVNGSLKLTVRQASGGMAPLANLGADLTADVTATSVRNLVLTFTQGGQPLGKAGLKGDYDLAKGEARITYEIEGIDRRVLALAGAATGIDVGQTTVSAGGRVDLKESFQVLNSAGQFRLGNLSVNLGTGPTPALDVRVDYQVMFNPGNKTATVEKLDLRGQQGGRDLVRGGLDRPMNLAWDKTTAGFRESTLSLRIDELVLNDWRALVGTNAPSGTLQATAKLTAERDGRLMKFELGLTGEGLTSPGSGPGLRDASLTLSTAGSLADFNRLTLERYAAEVKQGGATLVAANGLADWNLERAQGGAQFSLEGGLPALLGLAPIPGISALSGELKLSGTASRREQGGELILNAGLSRFSGRVQDMVFEDYQVGIQSTAGLKGDLLSVSRCSVALSRGYQSGGSVDLTGDFNLAQKKGAFTVRTTGLNEQALEPAVRPALAPRRLQSVQIDLNGKADVDLGAETRVAADLKVANLRVADPGEGPARPALALGAKFDAGWRGQALDLRQLVLDLGATPRARNELQASGRVDLAPTNAAPSQLTVRSEALDLTPLFDTFAGGPADASRPTPAPAPAPAPAGPEREPDPVTLPLRDLTLDLSVGRLYLREVDVRDWKARLAIKEGVVKLDPFALALNGAPVKAGATINLSVPGYRYDVNLSADSVPVTPVVDSFLPERKGQLGGAALVRFNVQGAGITGASLKQNLSGQYEASVTNLNLSLGNVKSAVLKTVLNVVLALPELVRNPGAAVGSLIGRLTGGSKGSSGWVDQFSAAPIESIALAGRAGGGVVELQQARMLSAAFDLRSRGAVRLNPVLTNSTLELPIQVALRTNLAATLGAKTSPTNTYALLPDFLQVTGTVGAPKSKVDYPQLALLGGQALLGGAVDGAGNTAKGVVEGLKNLVGAGGASTNAPGTNAPAGRAATNRLEAVGGLLRGLLGPGKETNAPANPATPPKPANPANPANPPKP